MRRVWGIIWRVLWIISAITVVEDSFSGCVKDDSMLEGILEFCFMCILINLPLYIWAYVQRGNLANGLDRIIYLLNWLRFGENYPIMVFVLDILLAPLFTVACIVLLAINTIQIITGNCEL